MIIAEIENRGDLQLVTDEKEIREIIASVSHELANNYSYGGIYVGQKEGEYTEVFGFKGSIPNLSKELFKIL